MVNERVGAGNWESGDELGDTWVSRNAFSYGRGAERGTARPEVLQELLKTTDRVVQVGGWGLPPCAFVSSCFLGSRPPLGYVAGTPFASLLSFLFRGRFHGILRNHLCRRLTP